MNITRITSTLGLGFFLFFLEELYPTCLLEVGGPR